MTIQEKKDFEKRMWDKHRIKITFKDNAEPYDENKVYFAEKVAAAKALFNRIGHPKVILQRINSQLAN